MNLVTKVFFIAFSLLVVVKSLPSGFYLFIYLFLIFYLFIYLSFCTDLDRSTIYGLHNLQQLFFTLFFTQAKTLTIIIDI